MSERYSRKKLDLTGQRFGRLAVIAPADIGGGSSLAANERTTTETKLSDRKSRRRADLAD